MCLDILLKLFGKKEEVHTSEEEITEEMISNEEEVIEEPITNQEEIVENEDTNNNVTEPIEPVITEPINEPYYGDSDLVILLDNGHASSTPGKRSPKLPDGRQFFEYEFNRDVVRRIARRLTDMGIKNYILVPEVDKDVALTTRANRANEYCKKYGTKNCLFISVHSNALGDGSKWMDAGKWSVWTTVGVTKSDTYAKTFYNVAEEMLAPYGFGCRDGKVQGNGNAGPDYEENFTVIYKAWCPAILTENLFYTNKRECEFLMSDEGRQVIANIHVEAIKRIIENC